MVSIMFFNYRWYRCPQWQPRSEVVPASSKNPKWYPSGLRQTCIGSWRSLRQHAVPASTTYCWPPLGSGCCDSQRPRPQHAWHAVRRSVALDDPVRSRSSCPSDRKRSALVVDLMRRSAWPMTRSKIPMVPLRRGSGFALVCAGPRSHRVRTTSQVDLQRLAVRLAL